MHNDYLAALDRLRRVKAKEDACKVYQTSYMRFAVSDIRKDKALVYDFEHDDTPATVEWIESIACGSKAVSGTGWERTVYYTESERPFASISDGVVSLIGLARPLTNPTRGDVLTLLRVFSERRAGQ